MFRSADDSNKASNNPAAFAFARLPEASSGHRKKSPMRHRNVSSPADQVAKVDKEDASDHGRNEDKLAAIDHTLAKVMSGLKTIDAIEQNSDVGGNENSNVKGSQRSTLNVSMTVPIIVKTSSAREDRQSEVSSLGSFSRGKKKSATLPKSGSVEKMSGNSDEDPQMRHAESSQLDATEGQSSSASRSSLFRSDSEPQRKDNLMSVNVVSSFGHHVRYDASSHAIPAATPVVPSSLHAAPSGAPGIPPKPSTARKPTVHSSPKPPRPSAGGTAGKPGKK